MEDASSAIIIQSDKQVYEALAFGAKAHIGGVVLESDTDDEAKALATAYASLWETPVKLYRVPAINMSGLSSFDLWPDTIEFIALIEIPPEQEAKALAAKLRAELQSKRAKAATSTNSTARTPVDQNVDQNPHMWIPNRTEEPFYEVCDLCGVFRYAHHDRPEPPAAAMPCPEPWPESKFTEEDFEALEAEVGKDHSAER